MEVTVSRHNKFAIAEEHKVSRLLGMTVLV